MILIFQNGLKENQDKFTSTGIQNEIIEIPALEIMRDIFEKFSGKWYIVRMDETGSFNKEQEVLPL